MQKIDIVYKVSHQAGLSTVEAVGAVNAVLSTVKSGVAGDGVVHLQGFGTFHRRQRWARMARNPNCGHSPRAMLVGSNPWPSSCTETVSVSPSTVKTTSARLARA